MARLRASWRTSLPVVQQPRNPQSESIARSPYDTLTQEPSHERAGPRPRLRREREVGALPPPAAEGVAAGACRPRRDPDGRADLGARRAERLVPPAPARRLARLLDEPAQGEEGRRALAPSPSPTRPRLRADGRVALPRARLGGAGGSY